MCQKTNLFFYVLYNLTISLTFMRHIGHFFLKNEVEHIPQQAKWPHGTKTMFASLSKQTLQS